MLSEVHATRGFVNSRQKHSYIDQSECSIIIVDFSVKFEHAVAEIFKVGDQLNPCQIAHMHAELSGGLLFMPTRACCLNWTPNGTKSSCKHLGSCSCVSCWQILDGNTTASNLSPASRSQDSAQQVQDNEGIVGNVVPVDTGNSIVNVTCSYINNSLIHDVHHSCSDDYTSIVQDSPEVITQSDSRVEHNMDGLLQNESTTPFSGLRPQ